MTPERIAQRNKTAQWLITCKPHRVLAYLNSLSEEEFDRAYQSRTGEDAQDFIDYMHDEVAKYGSN